MPQEVADTLSLPGVGIPQTASSDESPPSGYYVPSMANEVSPGMAELLSMMMQSATAGSTTPQAISGLENFTMPMGPPGSESNPLTTAVAARRVGGGGGVNAGPPTFAGGVMPYSDVEGGPPGNFMQRLLYSMSPPHVQKQLDARYKLQRQTAAAKKANEITQAIYKRLARFDTEGAKELLNEGMSTVAAMPELMPLVMKWTDMIKKRGEAYGTLKMIQARSSARLRAPNGEYYNTAQPGERATLEIIEKMLDPKSKMSDNERNNLADEWESMGDETVKLLYSGGDEYDIRFEKDYGFFLLHKPSGRAIDPIQLEGGKEAVNTPRTTPRTPPGTPPRTQEDLGAIPLDQPLPGRPTPPSTRQPTPSPLPEQPAPQPLPGQPPSGPPAPQPLQRYQPESGGPTRPPMSQKEIEETIRKQQEKFKTGPYDPQGYQPGSGTSTGRQRPQTSMLSDEELPVQLASGEPAIPQEEGDVLGDFQQMAQAPQFTIQPKDLQRERPPQVSPQPEQPQTREDIPGRRRTPAVPREGNEFQRYGRERLKFTPESWADFLRSNAKNVDEVKEKVRQWEAKSRLVSDQIHSHFGAMLGGQERNPFPSLNIGDRIISFDQMVDADFDQIAKWIDQADAYRAFNTARQSVAQKTADYVSTERVKIAALLPQLERLGDLLVDLDEPDGLGKAARRFYSLFPNKFLGINLPTAGLEASSSEWSLNEQQQIFNVMRTILNEQIDQVMPGDSIEKATLKQQINALTITNAKTAKNILGGFHLGQASRLGDLDKMLLDLPQQLYGPQQTPIAPQEQKLPSLKLEEPPSTRPSAKPSVSQQPPPVESTLPKTGDKGQKTTPGKPPKPKTPLQKFLTPRPEHRGLNPKVFDQYAPQDPGGLQPETTWRTRTLPQMVEQLKPDIQPMPPAQKQAFQAIPKFFGENLTGPGLQQNIQTGKQAASDFLKAITTEPTQPPMRPIEKTPSIFDYMEVTPPSFTPGPLIKAFQPPEQQSSPQGDELVFTRARPYAKTGSAAAFDRFMSRAMGEPRKTEPITPQYSKEQIKAMLERIRQEGQ